MLDTRGIKISDIQIENAIIALKKVQDQWLQNETKKSKLLGEDENADVFLHVSLKKIPEIKNIKMIKILLPNWPKTSRTVALFTGDLEIHNPTADCEETVRFYKKLLKKHNINGITEVISLRELRTDYKQFEARRKLSTSYDAFLADKKIAGCLPRVLGNAFMRNRKFPQQVNLKNKDLNKEIANALGHTVCYLTGRGSTCSIYVGSISQPNAELAENIASAVKIMSKALPGTGKNIQQLHLKCARSLAIPFYFSADSANNVQLPLPPLPEEAVEDEVSTLRTTKVRVYSDGKVDVLPLNDPDVSDADEIEEEIIKEEREREEKKHKKPKPQRKFGRKQELFDLSDAGEIEEEKEHGKKKRRKSKPQRKFDRKQELFDLSNAGEIEEEKENGKKKRRKSKPQIKFDRKQELFDLSDAGEIEEENEHGKKKRIKSKPQIKFDRKQELFDVSDAGEIEEEEEREKKKRRKSKSRRKFDRKQECV